MCRSLFGLQLRGKVAMMTALPMQILRIRCSSRCFQCWIGRAACNVELFGFQARREHASIYTEDEIRQLVKLSEESGHLNKEERTLINKVFEFSETTVKEAMIPRTEIVAIPETAAC